MRFFNSSASKRRKPASHVVLAIALATGSVLSLAVVAEPAHAEKKKKKKSKASYSKQFVKAYGPIDEVLKNNGDLATIKDQIPGLIALASSADEKFVAGNAAYNTATATQDSALQLQGMKLMLESGKPDLTQLGQFNYIAFQLSYNAKDYAGAREYLQQAINYNYSNPQITPDILRQNMIATYFEEGNTQGGLKYLADAISERKAAGQPVAEQWYRLGLTNAYENNITPDVYDFVLGWVGDYPSKDNWRDAINIVRNLNELPAAEMLDLLRLARTAGTLRDSIEYADFVEAADPRKLPQEVKGLIEEGYASGAVSRNDIFISDSLTTAKGRIAADRSELAGIEREARGAGVSQRIVVDAGDVFLNYGQYAKAEEFYTKALGMPGADLALVNTRLGITQMQMGKFAEAKASFDKVEGTRKPIAQLWSAYAAQSVQAGG